ncbi:hypothetical protein CSW10_00645 [Mesomycoplasma dispar]|uniref:Transposase n=2 Tax=Mesomycoplasma dispar TaxID=86660 RepID=A0ABM6PQM9_9BACT|nr:hypothetical protein [Mesomycoplasma dispar]ATP59471.1 hypothetical protein CSW10_00645 [Mesomycoplasma dispar]
MLEIKHGITLNERTIGRILSRNGLRTKTRQAKKGREIKDVFVKSQDFVKRDFNGVNANIVATGLTYIKSPKDILDNNVYLSIAIHHKSKKIINWNLSTSNDVELVYSHLKQNKI